MDLTYKRESSPREEKTKWKEISIVGVVGGRVLFILLRREEERESPGGDLYHPGIRRGGGKHAIFSWNGERKRKGRRSGTSNT